MFITVCILCALDVWLDVWRDRILWVPGPGVVGPFFLGGFQDGEDGAEGLGSRELGAHPAVAGGGAQEVLELAHAHGEVADGVTDLLALLEGDNRITLVDAHEMRMGLPKDSVGASVDLSELDTALCKGNSLSSEPSCSNDRRQVSNTYRSNDQKHGWSYPFTALS